MAFEWENTDGIDDIEDIDEQRRREIDKILRQTEQKLLNEGYQSLKSISLDEFSKRIAKFKTSVAEKGEKP